MSNNPANIRLGACRVRFGGKDLGLTKGGVDVELKTSTKMVQVDQFGTSTVNEWITGRELTVKVPFAETDLDSVYQMLKQSATQFIDTGTAATNMLTFSTNPTANDTITINGHVFTFVTAPTTPNGPSGTGVDQIALGATAAQTIANAATLLSASSDPLVQAGLYTAGTGTLTITYFQSGLAGNSFTVAKSSTGITLTGTTLTGGTNAGQRELQILTGNGVSLLTGAQELLLHPQNRQDDDYTEDFVVPMANTSGSFTFSYKLDQERVFNLTFNGYPNATTNVLATYGNKW